MTLRQSVSDQLGQALDRIGFFMCLDTEETAQGDASKRKVEKGQPNQFGFNNGTCVIYDDQGRPWIAAVRHQFRGFDLEVQRLATRFNLTEGCYVPHSNDGGYFMNHIMPKLRR